MELTSAKRLEEDGLALHHGFRRERPEVAQAQDGRAVRDDGHEVALVGVVVGEVGSSAMARQGTATPGE
jgi:hypothetical protein